MNTPIKLLVALSAVAILPACEPPDLKWGGWQDLGGPSKSSYLRVLRGRAANDLWAARDDGDVYHWDGNSWSSAGDLYGYHEAYDLQFIGGSAIWVVGDQAAYRSEDGAPFRRVDALTPATFRRVWGLSADDLWVQWEDASGQTGVLRWNGQGWRQVAEPFIPTWGSARNDAWAIRSGGLLHWDGVSWTAFNTPSVRAVWGLSSKQVWAVGEHETLLEWNGSTWRTLSTHENCFSYHDCATFRGVWGTGPGELWVVGENGPGFGGSAYGAIQKWDGKGWTVQMKYAESPKQSNENNEVGPLTNVFGFATGEVYATDGDRLLRLMR